MQTDIETHKILQIQSLLQWMPQVHQLATQRQMLHYKLLLLHAANGLFCRTTWVSW